ncbi:MAG: transcription termination factor Rho [Corynebacterium sp.]|nr:transcription termination factor Rho [Corynebacterium sp.]
MTNPENLNSLRLPELRDIATNLGLTKISALRKSALIEAIQNAQNNAGAGSEESPRSRRVRNQGTKNNRRLRATATEAPAAAKTEDNASAETTTDAPATAAASENSREEGTRRAGRPRRRVVRATTEELQEAADDSRPTTVTLISRSRKEEQENNNQAENQSESNQENNQENNEDRKFPESRSAARRQRRLRQRQALRDRQNQNKEERESAPDAAQAAETAERQEQLERIERNAERNSERNSERNERGQRRNARNNNRDNNRDNDRNADRNNNEQSESGEERQNTRGNRNNRNAERNAERAERNAERAERNAEAQQPAENPEDFQDIAGILDIVDNGVAFVRTTGYRESKTDVFVSQQMIRRFGLRRGDAVQGQVRTRPEPNSRNNNNRNRRHNALVRVTSVNGLSPEEARNRPRFSSLTPLYPNQRLRLETEPKVLTTRVIDLVMPIGKGQRALIVSPPKAGKTTILQDIANAITTNNPECKLMVVLVDERPEEVTDMQRSVKGEVIDSTFDRPPSEHTTVAELAIERAKRLVEMGHDVVVLLDSITRLGRAYNNSSPGSGRILSGGVDSNALYPPKRFLGAARNIEDGGSLTIIATAMVETGSAGDTVIFEEFKGTGNAELKLDRRIAERRVFPAVDINPSGTRKDELLLNPEEAKIVHKLRRLLSGMESQAAIDLLVKQLKKTNSNGEFLMQIAKTTAIEED